VSELNAAQKAELTALRSRNRRRKAAIDEVLSRRTHPQNARRFEGRIDLAVLCRPKGHALAFVYPTANGQVLVPTVSLILRDPKMPTLSERRQQYDHFRVQVQDGLTLPPASEMYPRYPWALPEDVEDDEEQTGRYYVVGTTWIEDTDQGRQQDYWSLRCRCGVRPLTIGDLLRALHDTTRPSEPEPCLFV
jgi:hypothetical protein